jgi:ATP-dependent DNA helicase PIF1
MSELNETETINNEEEIIEDIQKISIKNEEDINVELNEKQKEAINIVLSGKNLFLTGSAGTGKSYTLLYIVKLLQKKSKKFGLTAMTGCAASLINAQTLHSYLGLGLGKDTVENIIKNIKKRSTIYNRIKTLEVLIIDEISILDLELFEKISLILKKIKNNDKHYGDIQLILVGDFCQLPPINGKYCFESELWNELNIEIIELIELVRQQDDITFQKILHYVRKGKCTKKIYDILVILKDTKFDNDIEPTKLFPINVDVDKINECKFNKLIKENNNIIKIYKAKSSKDNSTIVDKYDVKLTIKAQVMITRNIDVLNGLVNGTRGVIIYMDNEEDFIVIKDIYGKKHKIEYFKDINQNVKNNESWILHMPVRLAYALSCHKSQGMTIDALEVDLGKNIFAAGQLYTALSRAKTLNSIKIIDIDAKSFITNSKVKKFYKL